MRVRLPAGASPGSLENSAFRPSGVGKSSTSLLAGGPRSLVSVLWRLTLCDPIWQVRWRPVAQGRVLVEVFIRLNFLGPAFSVAPRGCVLAKECYIVPVSDYYIALLGFGVHFAAYVGNDPCWLYTTAVLDPPRLLDSTLLTGRWPGGSLTFLFSPNCLGLLAVNWLFMARAAAVFRSTLYPRAATSNFNNNA